MEGYDDRTYGDAFADVYDEWYAGISEIDATVATLLDLAAGGPVLELGVGTGRLAVPLAAAATAIGVTVAGVDSSESMLARLAQRDVGGLVTPIRGSMVDDLPPGPFSLVFAAYNTLFNLRTDGEQRACFASVASRLGPGGRFAVEAFVPDDEASPDDVVSVRSLETGRVVLSISVQRPDEQVAEGQFVEFTEAHGIRLRPWSIRWATISQLDDMASAAGLTIEHRWATFAGQPFGADADRHVTVYRRIGP